MNKLLSAIRSSILDKNPLNDESHSCTREGCMDNSTIFTIWCGEYYKEGTLCEVYFLTENKAKEYLHAYGYRWNKEQNLFLNEDTSSWACIDTLELFQ